VALNPHWLADKSALVRLHWKPVAVRLKPLLTQRLLATSPIIDLEILYSARSFADYQKIMEERRALPSYPVNQQVTDRAMEVQQHLARTGRHRRHRRHDLRVGDRRHGHGGAGLAVYRTTVAAVERARRGLGPTLIEAKCYRWRGHNLGAAEHLYRPRDEVEKARRDDPIERFKEAMSDRLPPEEFEEVEAQVEQEILAAVRFAEGSPPPSAHLALEGSF